MTFNDDTGNSLFFRSSLRIGAVSDEFRVIWSRILMFASEALCYL